MSSSSSRDSNALLLVVAATTAAAAVVTALITAATTYMVTKRKEESKYRAIVLDKYKKEREQKLELSQVRKEQGLPLSGKLLDNIQLTKVYLWELVDLRTKFMSANVPNKMRFPPTSAIHHQTSYISPILRLSRSKSNNQLLDVAADSSWLSLSASNNNNNGTTTTSTTTAPPQPVSEQEYNKIIGDHDCVLQTIICKPNMPTSTIAYLRAGPRELLHFDPKSVSSAIVTCGGLCPGLNNVVRELTNTLFHMYGIQGKVYGIQGGYRGFYDTSLKPILLTPSLVENIHHEGGTCLGSSRGGFDLDKILDFLNAKSISQLYVIGGDGTHRGAFAIHEGCMERGYNVAVAGIPKTIDNDVDYIDKSFGFSSAVEAACLSIRSAKTEAVCNLPNGIGIVKLMGRSSGFIAAHATMASSDVDLCLVPEVPIVMEGEKGCLPHLLRRVEEQGFAVVVVAEGAGEELLGTSAETDASGNKKLPAIGEFMKTEIVKFFAKNGKTATVKYIDPSYTVRSVAANAADSLYCMQLAQNAVHGAMAGYTGFTVGLCNNRMVLLPIPELVATSPRSMNNRSRTWERVLALTRQPNTVEPLEPGQEDVYDSHAPMLR